MFVCVFVCFACLRHAIVKMSCVYQLCKEDHSNQNYYPNLITLFTSIFHVFRILQKVIVLLHSVIWRERESIVALMMFTVRVNIHSLFVYSYSNHSH